MSTVEILPLLGIPEVHAGVDLVDLLLSSITDSKLTLDENCILAIAQKIVSKAEGRYIRLSDIEPSSEAVRIANRDGRDPRLVEVVLQESNEVVVATDRALIVEHRSGAVCAHAGVDQSNLEGDEDIVLLLPRDADQSARNIRNELGRRTGVRPAVLIVDTQGRAFRRGVVGVTIGCAGLDPLLDLRGSPDRAGRPLKITQVAQADEIAAAASLVMGQGAEGIPAVLIRGYRYKQGERPASTLYRPKDEDLFRT